MSGVSELAPEKRTRDIKPFYRPDRAIRGKSTPWQEMSLLASEGGVCLNVIGREHLSERKVDQKANEFLELNKGFNLSHFELLHHQQNVLPESQPVFPRSVAGTGVSVC